MLKVTQGHNGNDGGSLI